MKHRRRALAMLLPLLVTPLRPRAAGADEITVLCSNGLQAVFSELAPAFERDAKHRVNVKYGLAAVLKQQIDSGEPFDLALLTPAAIDDLAASGRIARDTRTVVARSGLALEIRAGSPKPDVASVDAFKRTLLAAKAIAYARQGASGVLFVAVSERLGIADALKSKGRPTESGEEVSAAVLAGEADFGVLPLSEILPVKGAAVGGLFPAELDAYIVMVGGVNAKSPKSGPARDLLRYLTAPAALPVITAKGMQR